MRTHTEVTTGPENCAGKAVLGGGIGGSWVGLVVPGSPVPLVLYSAQVPARAWTKSLQSLTHGSLAFASIIQGLGQARSDWPGLSQTLQEFGSCLSCTWGRVSSQVAPGSLLLPALPLQTPPPRTALAAWPLPSSCSGFYV